MVLHIHGWICEKYSTNRYIILYLMAYSVLLLLAVLTDGILQGEKRAHRILVRKPHSHHILNVSIFWQCEI